MYDYKSMIAFYSVNGADYTLYVRRFVRFHFSPLDGAIFNASSLLAMCMKRDRALTEKQSPEMMAQQQSQSWASP